MRARTGSHVKETEKPLRPNNAFDRIGKPRLPMASRTVLVNRPARSWTSTSTIHTDAMVSLASRPGVGLAGRPARGPGGTRTKRGTRARRDPNSSSSSRPPGRPVVLGPNYNNRPRELRSRIPGGRARGTQGDPGGPGRARGTRGTQGDRAL